MRQFLLIILMVFSFALPASAEVEEYAIQQEKTEKHAQKIIEACKAPSKEDWDSGVTGRMMQGSDNYSSCLIKNITNLSNSFLSAKKTKKIS
jgi:hypothetical protein